MPIMDFSTMVEISSAVTCGAGAGADFATADSTMLCSRASSIPGAGAGVGCEQAIAATAIIAIIIIDNKSLLLVNKPFPPYSFRPSQYVATGFRLLLCPYNAPACQRVSPGAGVHLSHAQYRNVKSSSPPIYPGLIIASWRLFATD